MDKLTPEQLLDKYFAGQCSLEEKATLESWYLLQTENAVDKLPEPDYNGIELGMWQVIRFKAVPRNKILKLWPRIAAAVAILLIVATGLFYFHRNDGYDVAQHTAYQNISVGSNKAYLTLANGEKLSLTDAVDGRLAEQEGVDIIKTSKGELIYAVNNRKESNRTLINTITTPRGGQWQVRLPDGSSVWLNSSSSLTYPSAFNKGLRIVKLKGEAYFEVHKDPKHPFIVKTEQQEIRVLGTHFNVSAYHEDHLIKTTLLEGSVKVTTTHAGMKILKPGEQSELSSVHLSVKNVQAEDAIAWKNGYFMFNYEDLESVMMEISRWYDVELKYENTSVKREVFFGTISKYENISKVLNMLERTGVVKFRMDNKTVLISKK